MRKHSLKHALPHFTITANQEGLQILHYHDGQKYEPHNDYFHDDYNQRVQNGGQRVVTILMYL
jgi:prolyl 4-hydroxylase